MLADLARDLSYALRALRRNPMFASVAVLTLALGIGANTAIFSLADAVLLRTLPSASRASWSCFASAVRPGTFSRSPPLPQRISPEAATFSRDSPRFVRFQAPTSACRVRPNWHWPSWCRATTTPCSAFAPVVGRMLTEQDREPVAVISHRYWQRRFSGDPTVVGRAIEMQGRAFTIVGVTPAEFFGTQPGRDVDVTAPLSAQTMNMPPNARWLYLVGRLAPGVSREQARAALRVRWAQLAAATSSRPGPPVTLELDSGAQGLNELRREFSLPLRILMATVAVVLLVACANLAGLLIVRSSARQHEIAIRLSLGAARGRIVRQLLTESALLAAAGGAAGVVLAHWVTALLLAMMSRGRSPILLDTAPNAHTLVFAAAITIGTAALFGLLPAFGASRTDVQPRLKRGRVGCRSDADDLGAGVGGRAGRPARPPAHVRRPVYAYFAETTLRRRRFQPGAGARREYFDRPGLSRNRQACALRRTLFTIQRVTSRAVGQHVDGHAAAGDLSMGAGIRVPGRPPDPADAPQVYHNFVGPRFFETMGIPLVAGRDFELGDDERAPKHVVISEGVARRYFAGEDPLGRQILVGNPECRLCPPPAAASIVGVVKDVRYTSLRADAPLMIYRPYRQEPTAPADTFLIRTHSAGAEALTSLLQAEIRAAAPALPPPSVVSLEDRVDAVLVEERLLAALSSAIGVLAAMLAAVGIYSTVASAVARRQREIGVRMALGALPGDAVRMMVSEAFATVAGGLVLGVPAAFAAALAARSLLAGVLFELSPTDPLIVLGSTGAILLVASLAAYLPARRAARIDPVASLRSE